MLKKAAVLGGDKGLRQEVGHRRQGDDRPVFVEDPGNDSAVPVIDQGRLGRPVIGDTAQIGDAQGDQGKEQRTDKKGYDQGDTNQETDDMSCTAGLSLLPRPGFRLLFCEGGFFGWHGQESNGKICLFNYAGRTLSL